MTRYDNDRALLEHDNKKTTPITSMMSIELHLKKDCCVYPIA